MFWLASTRFRRWLLLVLGAPLLAKLLQGAADAVESRRGPGRPTSLMRTGADMLRKVAGRGGRRRRRGFFR